MVSQGRNWLPKAGWANSNTVAGLWPKLYLYLSVYPEIQILNGLQITYQ